MIQDQPALKYSRQEFLSNIDQTLKFNLTCLCKGHLNKNQRNRNFIKKKKALKILKEI